MAFEDNVLTHLNKRKAMANAFEEARNAMELYVKEIDSLMKKVEEARAISDFFINNPGYSLLNLVSSEATDSFRKKIENIERKEQTKIKALEEFYQTIRDEIASVSFNGYKLTKNYQDFYPLIMSAFCRKNRLPEDQIAIWQSSYNELYISNKLKDDLYSFLENDFTGLDKIIVSDEVSHHANITINEVISGVLATLSKREGIIRIDDSPKGFINKKVEENKTFLPNSFSSVKNELLQEYKKHLSDMNSEERKEKAISMSVSLKDKADDLKIPIGIN